MKPAIAACLFCLAGASAFADVVILKSGGRLEGVTSVSGDRLVIRLENGTVKIPLADVEKVESAVSPADEYASRAATLARRDVNGHLALADWCAEAGLSRCERIELEAVIAVDSNHPEARERLGYEKVGDRWLRGEDLLIARGMIKFEGRWVTASEAQELAADRDQLQAARREAEGRARASQAARGVESVTWGLRSRQMPRATTRRFSIRYERGCGYGRNYGCEVRAPNRGTCRPAPRSSVPGFGQGRSSGNPASPPKCERSVGTIGASRPNR
ncbi:MAG: hypothetical protein AAB074_05270 [Planctomycetota bacterium]